MSYRSGDDDEQQGLSSHSRSTMSSSASSSSSRSSKSLRRRRHRRRGHNHRKSASSSRSPSDDSYRSRSRTSRSRSRSRSRTRSRSSHHSRKDNDHRYRRERRHKYHQKDDSHEYKRRRHDGSRSPTNTGAASSSSSSSLSSASPEHRNSDNVRNIVGDKSNKLSSPHHYHQHSHHHRQYGEEIGADGNSRSNDTPRASSPPKTTKTTIQFGKPGTIAKPGIHIKLATAKPKTEQTKKITVASAFNNDSDDEVEEMPPECKMRMRNIGRDTPTSSGPNSFGKTKQGFIDSKKLFEKTLREAAME